VPTDINMKPVIYDCLLRSLPVFLLISFNFHSLRKLASFVFIKWSLSTFFALIGLIYLVKTILSDKNPRNTPENIRKQMDQLDPEEQLEFLRLAFLEYLSNWKGLSDDEVVHIKSILESPNDSRAILENFSDCLSKCMDEKEIESSIKIFLANYLSSHLDSLKLSLLIDVQGWIHRGLFDIWKLCNINHFKKRA
jgi:hypothetical protein